MPRDHWWKDIPADALRRALYEAAAAELDDMRRRPWVYTAKDHHAARMRAARLLGSPYNMPKTFIEKIRAQLMSAPTGARL